MKVESPETVKEDTTTCAGLGMIFEKSWWHIFSSLFHPFYLLVNIKVLGMIETESESRMTHVAAFGLASAFLAMVHVSTGTVFLQSVNGLIFQALKTRDLV